MVRVPGGRPLHEYVNLYINGRNPMMFTVAVAGNVDDLCLLRIGCEVLDIPGVVVTDCNASTDYVRFSDVDNGLARLDQGRLFAQYWTHSDPVEHRRHKALMCAEVLVPDLVTPGFVPAAPRGLHEGRTSFADLLTQSQRDSQQVQLLRMKGGASE